MYISGKSKIEATFDAIVVGSGISGGWAAMELCKKGMKTLLLERGRDVKHIQDYPTANLKPWDFGLRLNFSEQEKQNNPKKTQYADAGSQSFFANDVDHPYLEEKPFNWIRGYQVGGRSLTWGRQCYRLSDLDFAANKKDGHGVDWPIRYRDIAPWYSYVENFIGVSGQNENLGHLPDGSFLPPMELNCIENHLNNSIKKHNGDRLLTIARVANLTKGWDGRGPCQNRNLCTRGCPYGGYFSSNSSTIPAAFQTGNLTLRPYSIVSEIIYDNKSGKASGVRVIDTLTMETFEYSAKVIFLNASTIATAGIMLNSKSSRFPDGFGNDSGELGHNLMDHHSSAGAQGTHSSFQDSYYKGRRPCGFLIPRFRNLVPDTNAAFLRGYNIQGDGERYGWQEMGRNAGFGADFKKQLTRPGEWSVWMAGWGECLPYHDNRVSLDNDKKDKWGLPLIKIDFEFKENEKKMMADIQHTSQQMLADAGFNNIDSFNYKTVGGGTVHEMGTARMGEDPKTSVLNGNNQIHAVKNVFITDGSCMTSSACQNPSLTYMALTARACNYAVEELKKNNL
ncbi:GMC family oxidoreductase [Pedobacter antarcticus 4BY]|uniref:GMC family oxidoreductase n=2 Tax=Pedobacter antarcticus TaxID=34086 RepID=A0A081PDR7_9SPHI|nr:GMC family oxidoreductase [Pedobacter antarcticus]KEQ28840.1 GMC family oxidoreductase [Pedobacter antarcticus 4BY]SFF20406.1 Choline dehydrogenase [Pedobacter antarcticus]